MKTAKRFEDLPPYIPIEPFEVLSKRLGLPPTQITKLDANENLYGISPLTQDALASMPYANIYPDPESRELRESLARFTGIPTSNLMAGSGADELIDLILRVLLEPGDCVVNLPPTFGMYSFDTLLNAGQLLDVVRKPDFSLDLEKIKQIVYSKQPKAIFITSPNNPDGSLLTDDDLQKILTLPTMVILDEAYIEFTSAGGSLGERLSRFPEVLKRENLIVLRTFSKWAGLAGLRVGYGAFPGWILPALWKAKQPYNVSVAASTAALASINDRAILADRVKLIRTERDRLYRGLKQIPFLKPFPSEANFILCQMVDPETSQGELSAKLLKDKLAEHGVLVRYYNNDLLRNFIRISVGRPEDSWSFFTALLKIAQEKQLDTAWFDKLKSDYGDREQAHSSGASTSAVLRTAIVERNTSETQIRIKLNLDGSGQHSIHSGLPFLDHMLTQIAVHGLFDLDVEAKGDLEIDPHHVTEDIALVLGQAFFEALGDRRGITRMASAECPMDESMAHVVIDFSGRPYSVILAEWTSPIIGQIPSSLFPHFLESFAVQARCNLHVKLEYGRDDHHKTEAIFKALGRCLCAASRLDPRRSGAVPSSKGTLV